MNLYAESSAVLAWLLGEDRGREIERPSVNRPGQSTRRAFVLRAAEEGVSLNRLVSARLAD